MLWLWLDAIRLRPAFVHSTGLTREARYLLSLPALPPIYLHEITEALPHVKFIDPMIARRMHRAAALLATSQIIAENARRTYRFDGPIRILPLWVDPPPAVPPTVRSVGFAFLGRFDLDKGFAWLFEAFRLVHARRPDATLLVCGVGDEPAVRALAAGSPGITVRDPVRGAALEEVFAGCEAVVLPSLHEGYPLSLLEASARRRPIIATTVGSIPEVYQNRSCALLVPPRDAPALAAAMLTLLADDEPTRQARADDAAALFEERSSPAHVRTLLEALYP